MARPIRLRNLSTEPQTRWTWAMVPTAHLAKLGKVGIIKPEGWLWQRGAEVGDLTRLWIRADLAGNELHAIDLDGFADADDAVHLAPPTRFDWLLDKPEDSRIRLRLDALDVALPFAGIVEAGPLVSVFAFELAGAGYFAKVYAVVPVGQDVFDLQGFVVWSSRSSAAFTVSARIEIAHGEGHAPLLLASMGQQVVTPGRAPHVLLDGAPGNWLPDGMAIPFYGSMVAEPDIATDALTPDKLRLATARAAHGGPILALAGSAIWDGHIGPHGASVPRNASLPATTSFVDAPRSPWASRPWANAAQSGQTGDQGCFGRIKALHVFDDADPGELMPLRYSSTDYFLRTHHLLDTDSRPLRWDLNDGDRRTYNTEPFYRIAGRAWGKGADGWPPYGYDHERGGLDPQHRGNLYAPTSRALLGDFILADELDFLLSVECRDTRYGGQGDGSLEAPRAAGRLMQEWAHWWISASPLQRERLQWLADRMFGIVTAQPCWNVSGPIKLVEVMSRFDGKNPLRNTTDAAQGFDCWAPWQHSFVVDGLIAWAVIWQRLGDVVRTTKFLTAAVQLAHTVVDHSLIEHPTLGWIVCTYVRANADGAPNDAAYLTAPRPGAKTDLAGDADLIFGGIALSWWAGAILTAARAGNPKAQRAEAFLRATARTERDWEWLL